MLRWAAAVLLVLFAPSAQALGLLPFDPSLLSDGSLDSVLPPIIKTVGVYSDHRPYEPATPLGIHVGIDLSAEATLVKLPDDLLALQGSDPSTTSAVPLPSLKLHLHKGFGDSLDVGASFIQLGVNRMWGADMKIVLAQPEEGPTWAMRLCYGTAKLSADPVIVNTTTWTPQLLLSRQLQFADPYLGVGYQYIYGDVIFPETDFNGVTIPETNLGKATASSFMAFIGVSLKIPRAGVRLTLEGEYSSVGMHTLGTKIGFSF